MLFTWGEKHTEIKYSFLSSSLQTTLRTENHYRERWHVGVAQDGWLQFGASVSTPDRAVSGPSLAAVLDSVSQAQLKPGKQHNMLGC